MPHKTVLIVDDSAVVRGMISSFLEDQHDIEVIASASNGQIAVDLYKRHHPSIVLMDVEMPILNGIEALKQIIAYDANAKVIMCSTLTHKNAEISLEAMTIGAIEYIPKPTTSAEMGADSFKAALIRIINAVGSQPNTARNASPAKPASSDNASSTQSPCPSSVPSSMRGAFDLRGKPSTSWSPKILAIGSSTGGPQALFSFLKHLKDLSIPIVITQHMPATFTTILSNHITSQTGIVCVEGADDMALEAGKVFLAPGGKHMTFKKDDAGVVRIKLDDGPMENFCKPAVDPMLRSLISIYSHRILCTILTGMGHDGLEGCKQLVDMGGYVYAQDAESSIVWGMPGAVAKANICSGVYNVEKLAQTIKDIVH